MADGAAHRQLEESRVGVNGDTQMAKPKGPSAGGDAQKSQQSLPNLPAVQPPQLSPAAGLGATAELSKSAPLIRGAL